MSLYWSGASEQKTSALQVRNFPICWPKPIAGHRIQQPIPNFINIAKSLANFGTYFDKNTNTLTTNKRSNWLNH